MPWTLPNELFIPIIESVGCDQKTLLTLLTVSRHFYTLALPLLYKTLWISRRDLSDRRDLQFVVDKLYHGIEANPGLRSTTSLSFDLGCFFIPVPDIRTILPHLPSLRRLSIRGPSFIDPETLWLLPSTAQLTHLELQNTFYSHRFVDFLERHTALEFIHIGQLGRDTKIKDDAHPTLSRNAVPRLRSISVPLGVLQQFGGRTAVVDLEIPDLIAVPPASPFDIEAAFAPARTLSVDQIYFTGAPSWVSLLPNMRYLRVHMPPSDMDGSWRALSATSVAYVRFQSVSMPRESERPVRRLFGDVRSLALVDVGVVGGRLFYRYYRDSEGKLKVPIPHCQWKPWWASAEDDIADAVKRCSAARFG
ncbi:F-box domain-containing protein [Pleurotus pulmonarius]